MSMHSFHLAHVQVLDGVRALIRSPRPVGLERVEVMAQMELGAPVLTPARMQLNQLAVFCQWRDAEDLDRHLTADGFGRQLASGWHVRLEYERRWGQVRQWAHLPELARRTDLDGPSVAVTLARLKLTQLPRFIVWGRPVERQVRDHPQARLALAAMRPPHTVSTFSSWTSARAMTGMVWGRDQGASAELHRRAMAERDRRDFHHEFTTLRFRPLSEHGLLPEHREASDTSRDRSQP